ncbi:MAG: terminase family protein [Acidobacteriota bacterium]
MKLRSAPLAQRILRLPARERELAVGYLQVLVEARRDELKRRRRDCIDLARGAGIEPDNWQAQVLKSTSPRILLNCSRQSGKSTVTALLAVHTALYEADALVLLLSPSLRQSQELFRKALGLYQTLDRPIPAESESALRLEVENGSRVVSLPGTSSTIRGYSGVRLLAIDEAARVPDDLYFAVRPMLAVSGGRLICLSTPFGTRGWWYDAWRSDEPWERYEVPASECPRISPEFLEEERLAMGEWWFEQEYGCLFAEAENQPFSREDVERAFSEDLEAWDL